MFRKIFVGAILGLTPILLAACGNAQPTPTPTVVVTPLPAVTPTAPVLQGTATVPRPTPPVSGWNSKVTYEVTGGIAGIKRTLLVGPAGQARLIDGANNSGPVKISAERLAQIKAKLDAVDFFKLQDHYGNGNVSDDFLLTISITQDDQTKTVQVEQEGGKGVTPQALLDFIDDLENLRTEIEARGMGTATPVTATATVVSRIGWNATLTYTTKGGIMGMSQILDIDAQGNATLGDATPNDPHRILAQSTIALETLGQIMSKLDAAQFFELKDEYGQVVPDGFVYSLSITQNGKTKTVTMAQDIENATPAEVSELFRTVEGVAVELRGLATPTVTALPAQTTESRVGWNVTLSYAKGGGFAGVDQKLEIDAQGNATLKDRDVTVAQTTIEPEHLGQIMSSLNSAQFFTLEESYGIPLRDGFTYSLTITQNGRTKTVNYAQGNEVSIPEQVRELSATVQSVAEGVRATSTPGPTVMP